MHNTEQAQLLRILETGWAQLPARFDALTPAEQAAYLQRQGYARLGDLLAHVLAWWEAARPALERMAAGEDVPSLNVDVDRFNAAAVARRAADSETAVRAAYLAGLNSLAALLRGLPCAAWDNPALVARLRMEIRGHAEEHEVRSESMQPEHWEQFWSLEGNHDFWERPAPEVVAFSETLSPVAMPRVLDQGCGLGRHAILFAALGFTVTASDASATAVAHVQDWAQRAGLQIDTRVCDALQDDFAPASFDVVLSYNVIYHGYREVFSARIQHIRELLRMGGLFFLTAHTRRDQKYGEGQQVAPHTYLSPNSITPGDMHYFTDEADLRELLAGFEIESLALDEHEWELNGQPRFASNYIVIARRVR